MGNERLVVKLTGPGIKFEAMEDVGDEVRRRGTLRRIRCHTCLPIGSQRGKYTQRGGNQRQSWDERESPSANNPSRRSDDHKCESEECETITLITGP